MKVRGCLPLLKTTEKERNFGMNRNYRRRSALFDPTSNLRCYAREPLKPLGIKYYNEMMRSFQMKALHDFVKISALLKKKARGGMVAREEAALQQAHEAMEARRSAKMDREQSMELALEDAMMDRDDLGDASTVGYGKKIGKWVKKGVKSVGKSIKKAAGGMLKAMIPKLIALAVKLCPKQYRPMIKRMVPHILKGKIMKALMEGMPLIIKVVTSLVDKFFKPTMRPAVKHVITKSLRTYAGLDKGKGTKIQRIFMIVLSKYKSLILEPLAGSLKLNGAIGLECHIRKFALHIIDPAYETMTYSNTCPGLDQSTGHCGNARKANGRDPWKGPNCGDQKPDGESDHGPLNMEVVRMKKGKPVCSFTFMADQHKCMTDFDALKIPRDDPRQQSGQDCCHSATMSLPRTSSSKYNPRLQVQGNNCRLWYLGTMSLVQLVTSLMYQISSSVNLRKCLGSGCTNMERCSRSSCTSGALGNSCKWVANPDLVKMPWLVSAKKIGGYCKGPRL